MNALEHREYQEEKNQLETTIERIENLINQPTRKAQGGGDRWANHSLTIDDQEKRQKLQHALNSPYFSRVDFKTDELDTFYIGKPGLELKNYHIIDWRAPIANLLYSSSFREQSYQAPGGTISGELLLRRHFDIRGRKLVEITDVLDYRDDYDSEKANQTSEKFLVNTLQNRGDTELQDIVQTIQAEQNEIIRAEADKIVVIDGVAGSGKTSIAFHRLAYLLFPKEGIKLNPNQCIVFCPNKIFLHYIEDLLPDLGVNNVQQTTFTDWAVDQMSLKGYAFVDTALKRFTRQDADKETLKSLWRTAQIKGRLSFINLLRKFVEFKRSQIQFPNEIVLVPSHKQYGKLVISFSFNEIDSIKQNISLAEEMPLNELRKKYVNDFVDLLKQKLGDSFLEMITIFEEASQKRAVEAANIDDQEERYRVINEAYELKKQADPYRRAQSIPRTNQNLINDLKEQLKEKFAVFWPEFQVVEEYYGLLQNLDLLKTLNEGEYSETELTYFAQSVFDGVSIELEDVPAIFQLYLLVNRKPKVQFDYIIVDEVQDCSPLLLKMISKFCKQNRMTLVGDLSQAIHAYRGLNNWDTLISIFGSENHKLVEVNRNYRNTKEIVDLTNKILTWLELDEEKSYPIPTERSGPTPKLAEYDNEQEMYKAIVKEIDYIKETLGYENIALITKSTQEAENLILRMSDHGIDLPTAILKNPDYKYAGGVLCLPIISAKGLEFEAAILIDVNQDRYNTGTRYDGQLLYVAATRALHYLCAFSVGAQSQYFTEKAKAG